eukprot:m51a1_g6931 hypothetical protein (808) ;mRNA; r:189410-192624
MDTDQATWTLRHLVVPRISNAADLSDLALALPCALCTPCFLRIAEISQGPVPTKRTPTSSSYTAVLAVALAGQPTPRPLAELVKRCPGFGDALLASQRGLSNALAAVCAAPLGDPETLRLLASLPRVQPAVLADAAAYAVTVACRQQGSGSSGRTAMLVRELSREPLLAHTGPPTYLTGALALACSRGHTEAVGVLTAAPYSLTRKHLLHPNNAGKSALDYACASGCVDLVEALAVPPLRVCRADLLGRGVSALLCAVSSGHAGVVARLSQPPFLMGHAEALTCNAAVVAAGLRSASMLDVLAAEPYSVCSNSAELRRRQAQSACRTGSREVVRRLAQPPYRLGHTEAVEGVRDACLAGNVEVLDAFAEPPYSLMSNDVATAGHMLLVGACAGGHMGIIRRLSQAPYNLGISAASGLNCAALTGACMVGHAHIVEELGKPPYSLGPEDARTADALAVSCKEGRTEVVRVLARPPFCLGHSDAASNSNQCLFLACLSGQADLVRVLSEPPYSIAFDPENIGSVADSLVPFVELARADAGLRSRAQSAIKDSLAKFEKDNNFACSLLRSGCVAACIAWHMHSQLPSDAYPLLYRLFESWDSSRECLARIIGSCIGVQPQRHAAAKASVAFMERVSLPGPIHRWKLSVKMYLQMLRTGIRQRVIDGNIPMNAEIAVGGLYRLYSEGSDTLIDAGWDVHEATLAGIASLPDNAVTNKIAVQSHALRVVRMVSQVEEFAPWVIESGVIGALATLIGGSPSPKLIPFVAQLLSPLLSKLQEAASALMDNSQRQEAQDLLAMFEGKDREIAADE